MSLADGWQREFEEKQICIGASVGNLGTSQPAEVRDIDPLTHFRAHVPIIKSREHVRWNSFKSSM
jgi:hypothetical protein